MSPVRMSAVQQAISRGKVRGVRNVRHRRLPSGCRAFTSGKESDQLYRLCSSASSLGLISEFVAPRLASIRQLPEVESSLNTTDTTSSSALQGIERAVQVFEMMNKGGPEHLAVLALLAQFQQTAGRYTAAFSTLDKLSQLTSGSANLDLQEAQAKVLWYEGDFAASLEKCKHIADKDGCPALRQACALNGMGVSSLLALPAEDIHEADAVRELLQVACKTAENAYRETPLSVELGLAGSACYGNLGVAQFLYSDILSKKVPDMPVPKYAALQAWRDGLNLLEEVESFPTLSERRFSLLNLMRARLHANMAWALLQDDDDENNLSIASEYAREALSTYEDHSGLSESAKQACLGRALTLVAMCYHKTDSAVTAEGLFQTAVDSLGRGVGPLEMMDLRHACAQYASLCMQWEKREGDSLALEKRSKEVNNSLAESWRGKSEVFSGLWFFTTGDFS